MTAIRKRFLYCMAGTLLCSGIAVGFAFCSSWHAVVPFAAMGIVLMTLTFRASESYRSARLICEYPILNVNVASVLTTGDSTTESTVGVIVSGFGVLMGEKPYKFGHGGVTLTSVAIDRESIALSFNGEEKTYYLRLLHGVASKADIDRLHERLRYETGVVADVSGW